MDQDSIEDVILNGNVQTPIKDSEIIGRSGAKMLGMVSDLMEYQSFTEESAMEDNEEITKLIVKSIKMQRMKQKHFTVTK